MKRFLVTGLLAVAATAVAAAPAQAQGATPIDSPSAGSAEVIPECSGGPMVQFNGTGSAAVDFGAEILAWVPLYLLPGANSGSGENAAVEGPCEDAAERGAMTRLLTYLHSGSAHS